MSYPLEGLVSLFSEKHEAEADGGCACGFVAWSLPHVAIMAYREAVDWASDHPKQFHPA